MVAAFCCEFVIMALHLLYSIFSGLRIMGIRKKLKKKGPHHVENAFMIIGNIFYKYKPPQKNQIMAKLE